MTKPTLWKDEHHQANNSLKARNLYKNGSVSTLGRASSRNTSCGEQSKPSDGKNVNGILKTNNVGTSEQVQIISPNLMLFFSKFKLNQHCVNLRN